MIKPSVNNEYGHLEKVVMCLANAVDFDATNIPPDLIDEAAMHQAVRHPQRPYDQALVHRQQQALAKVIENNGGDVLWAKPLGSGVAQHYTRDVGFTVGSVTIVDRPRRPYRRRELEGLDPVLEQIETVARVTRGCIEGGDVMVDRDTLIIGLGEETDREGIANVEEILSDHGIDMPVRTLEFTHRGVIHTDTLFNIVAEGVAIIQRDSFGEDDLKWLSSRFELIDATQDEAGGMEINTLAIGGGKVVMLAPGGRLADEIAKKGLEPILLDYSEVIALPGSFRCTTFPIVRR
ncbi:arginine deiminase family protein [uncultured Algimonas sp.]|uniref:dimethylarginine dimethylaminohydrolase family protein n=1 Tax=uncultured Algimonas sp. TaxID=1547920 RepID=UPI002607E799|nr:arginine deiminase family protein [uncultured Algimonas sp.]